jgi:hypothetical protein
MAATLDDEYLTWLYSQVASVRQTKPSGTYWKLFKQLYTKEFVWFVPNDDNRVEDGRALRHEFFKENDMDGDPTWDGMSCSFLELLIGLSRRLSFEAEGPPDDWFWHILDNIDLTNYTDADRFDPGDVEELLDQVIWRTYDPDGYGGLFPLRYPDEDQRGEELWNQLCAYVLERPS